MRVQFSFSKEAITPKCPMDLVGLPRRSKKMRPLGIGELYVRILWLRADNDVIFISIDSLYFSREVADAIIEYTSIKYNIPTERIIFNASHTHSAPCQDIVYFGSIDASFLNDIHSKIRKGLDACHNKMTSGFIECTHIDSGLNLFINRRMSGRDIKSFFLRKRIIRLPNKESPVDNKIHLMKLYNENGNLEGIVYNFSCHPVFNTSDNVSSDYVGVISNELENKCCKFSMFLQGFAGDVRPNYTKLKSRVTDLINFIKLLFNDEVFCDLEEVHFNHFCHAISKIIIRDALLQRSSDDERTENKCSISAHMYDDILESQTGKTKKKFTIKIVGIGNNLFISIPAEVFSRYFFIISSKFHGLGIYPLGYADGMIGYLPSEEDIYKGGYEVSQAYKYYGWDDHISAPSVHKFTNRLLYEIDNFLHYQKDHVAEI